MGNNRLDKINNELKKAIAEVLNNKFRDLLNNSIISVVSAKTSLNLEYCDVYVSIFSANKNELEIYNLILKNLTEIRSAVSRIIKLRSMPKLNVHLDRSEEYSAHINNLLKEIKSKK